MKGENDGLRAYAVLMLPLAGKLSMYVSTKSTSAFNFSRTPPREMIFLKPTKCHAVQRAACTLHYLKDGPKMMNGVQVQIEGCI